MRPVCFALGILVLAIPSAAAIDPATDDPLSNAAPENGSSDRSRQSVALARPEGFRYQGIAGLIGVRASWPGQSGFATGFILCLVIIEYRMVRKLRHDETLREMNRIHGGDNPLPGVSSAGVVFTAAVSGAVAYGLAWGQPIDGLGWLLAALSVLCAALASAFANRSALVPSKAGRRR